jgi:hypothetical protein
MNHHRIFAAGLSAAVALLIGATPSVQGASFVFAANLSGAAEDPPIVSPGSGSATVTYDSLAQTLRVQFSFSDLAGLTTVAHIHGPTAVAGAGNAGVATQTPSFVGFPAGVTAGSYDQVFDLTDASSFNPAFLAVVGGGTEAGAEAALAAALIDGKAYLNIHTAFAPGGEIRGFLVPSVPEPGMGWAGALVFFGLVGMNAWRRRT